jgi:MFS family permease
MNYLRFLLSDPRLLSFGFTLNVFIALGQTFYISLFNADIRAELDLTNGELAAVYGSATIVGSVILLVVGRLIDKVDLRAFAGATTVMVAFGCWFLANVTTPFMLFLAMLAVRFSAQSLWGVCAQVSMARYFDETRGKAAAVANTGYALGYAVFPLIGASLLAVFGWREAWTYTSLAVLIFILPLIALQLWGHGKRHAAYEARLKQLSEADGATAGLQWPLGKVLRDIRFWLIQPSMLAVPSVIFSIQFHQVFLADAKGWSITAFAGGYTVYSLVSLVAMLVSGAMVDRVGSLRLVSISIWPLIPALLVLVFVDHPIGIVLLMMCTGMTFGVGLILFVTIWAEFYGTKHMGAIRSFNVFMNVSVASAVMVLTGWLIDRGTSVAQMAAGGIVVVLLSLLLLYFVRRPRGASAATSVEAN